MTPLELATRLGGCNAQFRSVDTVTPLQARRDISHDLGVELLIKREDRLDDVGSGHKWRKLAFLRETIVDSGADVLITAGSLPSGQCVAVAALACRLGLESRLIYLGDIQQRPACAAGHYLYASQLATRIEWFERTPWSEVEGLLKRAAASEIQAGKHPFIISPGIPEWPAGLGSIELGLQLFEQLNRLDQPHHRTHVVALAGTGGTCIGLSIASEALGAGWAVHGICMGSSASEKWKHMARLADEQVRFLGLSSGDLRGLHLHEFDWSGPYAMPSEFELATMRRALEHYLLPLDPNYMVKAFAGAEALTRSGVFSKGDRVILVHSGGSVDFVAGTPLASEWLGRGHVHRLVAYDKLA